MGRALTGLVALLGVGAAHGQATCVQRGAVSHWRTSLGLAFSLDLLSPHTSTRSRIFPCFAERSFEIGDWLPSSPPPHPRTSAQCKALQCEIGEAALGQHILLPHSLQAPSDTDMASW